MKFHPEIDEVSPLKSFDFTGLSLFSTNELLAANALCEELKKDGCIDVYLLVEKTIINEKLVFSKVASFLEREDLISYITDNYWSLTQEVIVINTITKEYNKKIVTSSCYLNSLN